MLREYVRTGDDAEECDVLVPTLAELCDNLAHAEMVGDAAVLAAFPLDSHTLQVDNGGNHGLPPLSPVTPGSTVLEF